jgi:hypothetical protein
LVVGLRSDRVGGFSWVATSLARSGILLIGLSSRLFDNCQREQRVIVEPLPQDLIRGFGLTQYFYVCKLADCLWIVFQRLQQAVLLQRSARAVPLLL